jgi:carboxypeptidase family protein/TonB-dependent receptor-like protein
LLLAQILLDKRCVKFIEEKLMNTIAVRFSRILAVALLALLNGFSIGAPSSNAQSFRGSIRGTITDAHSLAIPGTKIVTRNLGTSETREVTSDSEGDYSFVELPAGEYEVAAIAPGFQEVRAPHVIVNVGEATVLNLKLAKPMEKVEQVIVSENVPLMETDTATLSQVVDRQLVQELPLNGRDFGKLVALTPGVTVEGSGVAGSEKATGQFNINGNRDRSNNYTLDGTDNNDPFFNNSALNQVGIAGAPATLLPLDAIQEFNLQSQFGAEYGRNTGSVVNIITRSGTNNFHGSLYQYNRNTAFDARNFFNTSLNPQSHLNNNNFGGSLGGPVIKDRTFFFGAYEGQRERVGSDFNFQVPTPRDIATARLDAGISLATPPTPADKILAFFPVSNSRTLPSTVHDTSDDDNFIVKVDHRLNSSNTLTGRYAFGQGHQQFPFGSLGGFGSGSRLATFANDSPTRVQVISTSLLTTFSPSKLNELRFGYSRFRTNFRSIDDTFDPSASLGLNFGTGKLGLPEFDFNGAIENLGASGFSLPRGRLSETFQTLDNFTWIRGRHTIKFGGEHHRYDVQSFNDNLERGILDVNAATITGDPVIDNLIALYQGNFFPSADAGNTHRFTFNNGLSFFAQDAIRVRPNLTLNVGLRWEYSGPLGEYANLLSNLDASGNLVQVGSSMLPNLYNRDLNNFGPRIGFAWNALRNTVVRAGYGLYYDYLPQNNLIANVTTSAGVATNPVPSLTNTPNFVGGLNFNQNGFTNPSPSNPIFSGFSTPQSIFVTDRNLRTPYVGNWNLNIQQQLGGKAAFEIGYLGSKGTKLSRLYDANQARTNTTFNAIDVFSDGANSTYHALQTTVRLQTWHRLSGFSTYTWSKSLDGASDGINFNFANAAFPQDSTNLQAEKGPSTFDTRHRWTSALNYQAPVIPHLPRLFAEGWQLNTILIVQTGRPINIVTSNGGVNFNFVQRPDVVPGQPFILPNWTPDTGYLNPLAFANPAITPQDPNGFFGNLGRDQVYGPGFWNTDFSISKKFAVREKLSLQFRGELFNIFNHPNFALPTNVVNIGAPNAGLITQTPDVAQGNPGLGGGGPRVVQLGLRLQF